MRIAEGWQTHSEHRTFEASIENIMKNNGLYFAMCPSQSKIMKFVAAAPKTAMEFPLYDKGYRYVVVMVPQTGIHNFASIHGSSVYGQFGT